MLPSHIRQGVRPNLSSHPHIPLRAARGALVTAHKPTATGLDSAYAGHQIRSITWWPRKLEHFNQCRPHFHRYRRSQYGITKAKLFEYLNCKWYNPDLPGSSFGWRLNSSWGKPHGRWFGSSQHSKWDKKRERKTEDEDYEPFELSPRERLWRQRIDEIKRRMDEDPYGALFGRHAFDMRSGLWNSPFIPRWIRDEMRSLQSFFEPEQPVQEKGKNGQQGAPSSSTQNQSDKPSTKPPVFVYDPISNRMVLQQDKPSSEPETVKKPTIEVSSDGAVDIPVKPYRPKPSSNDTATSKSSPDSSKQSHIKSAEPVQPQYQDPLEASLAEYDQRMREQPPNPPAPLEEWLVQERFTHGKRKSDSLEKKNEAPSSPLKDSKSKEDLPDAAPGPETQRRRPVLPKDDIDLLRSSDVRASMGVSKRRTSQSDEQKGTQRAKLEEDFAKVHEEEPCDQWGYSLKPQGLETSYAREVQAKKAQDLLKDVEESSQSAASTHHPPEESPKPDNQQIDQQLQILDEQRKRLEALEVRLSKLVKWQSVSQPKTDEYGYDLTPQGLATSYALECERKKAGVKTPGELKAEREAAAPSAEVDPSDKTPQGLKTSYARELAAGRMLEDEIKAQQAAMQAFEEDGYSRQPMGLETSYARELAAYKNGRKTLEQELSGEKSDTAPPVKLESSLERRAREDAARKAEQKQRDVALVKEVRGIYEDHYGVIDTNHRQVKPVNEFEGRIDEGVHKCLEEYDRKNPDAYKFTTGQDNLEKELATQQQEITVSQASPTSNGPLPVVADIANPSDQRPPAPSKIHTEQSPAPAVSASSTSSTGTPRYRMLSYDPLHDKMDISESYLPDLDARAQPFSDILNTVRYPIKYFPHIQSLRQEGFEPVSSGSYMMLFKQQHAQPQGTPSRLSTNPVDGTSAPPAPQTGNFASPTGFVNHDAYEMPPVAPARSMPASSTSPGGPGPLYGGPTVRRTERVFSGANLRRRDKRERRKDRRRYRKLVMKSFAVLGGGVLFAYLVGVMVELRRLWY